MGYPTALYTSVQHLPIGWNIPYQPQSETQSIVYTKDNGVTWIKYEGNPVIPHPPADLNVTGWRDPLVFRDENLANALGDPVDTIYTPVSSGERPTSGGRFLLYRAQNANMTSWDYLGPMFQANGNESYSPFSGNYGFNFEMGGYRSLIDDEGEVLHVITYGTEGGRTDVYGNATHGNHWPLFTAGSVNSSGVLTPTMSGVLDWGETYAYLGVDDPTCGRRLLWNWIYEDDNGYGMTVKGWQGSLGLVRVLSVNTIKGVTDSVAKATEKGYWDAQAESDGTFTIRVCLSLINLTVDLGPRSDSGIHDPSRTGCNFVFSTPNDLDERISESLHRAILALRTLRISQFDRNFCRRVDSSQIPHQLRGNDYLH
jgi:beta-fructofuranosidase